jgi:hypothetical protein
LRVGVDDPNSFTGAHCSNGKVHSESVFPTPPFIAVSAIDFIVQ